MATAIQQQRCKYTTWMDIQNLLLKAPVTHSDHVTKAQCICSKVEDSAM